MAKKNGEEMGVLGFLRRAIAATMGCLFSCFGKNDSQYHLVSTPKKHRAPRNKNVLSSLFLCDESEKDSDIEEGEAGSPLSQEIDVRSSGSSPSCRALFEQAEVKIFIPQAKFLKACGTLLETPVEIRKASSKCADISTNIEEASKLNSRISSASIEKLKLEEQHDESSTPVKICNEWVTGAGFWWALLADFLMAHPMVISRAIFNIVGNPTTYSLLSILSVSCMIAGHSSGSDSVNLTQKSDIQNAITPKKDMPDNESAWSAISFAASGTFATSVKGTNKSVRFECQSDSSTFSSEDSCPQSEESESSGSSSLSKPSPHPTPLKLSDEMQTPGTVYPAYVNNIPGVRTAKIRSQYVYSILKPIEHLPQLKEVKREKSDSNPLRQSPEPNDEATLIASPISGTLKDEISVGNDWKEEASLSAWLKPQDGNHELLGITSGEKFNCGRTPGDRPILSMVGAHWNEDGTHVTPKWWDGNGIPNTTTKYKEDQKVTWHATPFEERLEKALCEDTSISQRRSVSGTPSIVLSEIEEYDAAVSELKAVVSF